MKKYFKIISVFLALCMLFSLTACSNTKGKAVAKYILPDDLTTIDDGVVSENENFSMIWNDENSAVFIKDKKNNKTYCTLPEEYLKRETDGSKYQNEGLLSGITVSYYNAEKKSEVDISSYSGADYVTAATVKSGLRVTYYFDSLKFSVPILFSLNDTGISVSVEVNGIRERENKIISVSVLPFFASCKNNTDSYIFVPSGSGAIMNTDDNKRSVRYYDEPVYGDDAAAQSINNNVISQTVRIPAFGVKNVNSGIFAVIEKGAEASRIKATVGDSQYGYSGVYASFTLRGKATTYIKTAEGSNSEVNKYTDGFINIPKPTVRYYLIDKNADYNAFADCYKEYLKGTEKNKKTVSQPDVFLNVLGGYNVRRLALGIPYFTLNTLTTCDQTLEILKDLSKQTKAEMQVNLSGFSSSGLDFGKFAGGFKIDGKFGGQKALESLNKWCKSNNTALSADFDLVFFNESSNGFSTRTSATTVNDTRALFYDYSIPTHLQETSKRSAYLANRNRLVTSKDYIAEKSKDAGLDLIGYSTLSNTCYSDYRDENYFCRTHMADDVKAILKAANKSGLKIFGTESNDYAAACLDYVFATPTSSSGYFSLDYDIPFYQMVFKGRVAMSGESVNLAVNPRKEFLKAVQSGISLGFTVCDHTDENLQSSVHSAAAASVYKDIKDSISDYIEEIKPFNEKVGNSAIKKFTYNNGVTKTEFENKTAVYVNFTEKDVQTEFGTVKANSFIYK